MIHDTYADSRAAFLEAARDRSATLSEHILSGAKGALGETLAMDVAVVGDARAPKALLIVSGEHGLEGAPGSAAQRAVLQQLPAPPADMQIVLVHALNPWGFSHRSRANEENIDVRSEEHTSELQSLMRISYAVFCLKKKKQIKQ